MDAWMHGLVDGWMDGWVNGWVNECMDKKKKVMERKRKSNQNG